MAEPTQIKAALLFHTCEKYATKQKSPDLKTHVNIPVLPAFNMKPAIRNSSKFYYGIRIVTGDQSDAGRPAASDTAVYIKLTGAKHTTGVIQVIAKHGLSTLIKSFFAKSSFDDILIECDAELDIDVLTAGLTGTIPSNHWYIDFMQTYDLQKDGAVKTFACYHWIGSSTTEVSCTSQTSIMKNVQSNPVLIKHRNDQLAKRKKLYLWKPYPTLGLPSSIKEDNQDIPQDEEFERAKDVDFVTNGIAGRVISKVVSATDELSAAFSKILGFSVKDNNESVSSLDKYEDFAIANRKHNLDEKTINRGVYVYEGYRWVTDVEFGRQVLNGVNPIIVKKCTALPSNFPVTDEMVQNFIRHDSSLSNEMKLGRVYICDLSEIMDGIPCREGHYCPAPICLLYVNAADQLVPIAIQLKKDPGPENPIFFPTDPYLDWLLAKIYYRSAENQNHQINTHYVLCHASIEAQCVALMRTLPDCHPVYKLLRPHFRYTMGINSAGRKQLMNEGGSVDKAFSIGGAGRVEFFKRCGRHFNVHLNNIKRSIKERRVDDPNQLPGYYYRDDGLKIWNAIETYVKDILDIFYTSDADVKEDPELQNWAKEVHNEAFPAYEDNPVGRGFPESMNTKDELIEYCTLIIFSGTAQHAAVNFGQFDLYGYVPNSPVAIRQPPPNKKGTVTYAHLLNSLPDTFTTSLTASVTSLLVQYSPDEIFIGGYQKHWFVEKEALDAEKKFLSNLKRIEEEIKERNKTIDVPYEYLLPSQVTNSITI